MSKYAFLGEGLSLNNNEPDVVHGNGKGKRANRLAVDRRDTTISVTRLTDSNSTRAREERALAAERRQKVPWQQNGTGMF